MPNKNKETFDLMDETDAPSSVKRPRRSFFTDEPGHNMVVMIDDCAVYARECGRELLDALSLADETMEKEALRIEKERKPGKAPNTGKPTPALLTQEEASRQTEQAMADHRKAYNGVLCQLITDWELPSHDGTPRPYSPEAVEKLPRSIVLELIKKILQKTTLGADETDFLSAA